MPISILLHPRTSNVAQYNLPAIKFQRMPQFAEGGARCHEMQRLSTVKNSQSL